MCANGHRVAGNYAAEAGRLGDRAVLALFILVVGFLGCYGLLAPPGARGLNATIFPEILSMFSLRSFGVFYLTLALCTVPAFLSGRRSELLAHAFAMYGLIVFITIAAAAFPEIWRFAERPHQYIYPGIYLLVGLGAAGYLLRFGSGRVPHNSEPAVRTG
jgi:cation transport ATPase